MPIPIFQEIDELHHANQTLNPEFFTTDKKPCCTNFVPQYNKYEIHKSWKYRSDRF